MIIIKRVLSTGQGCILLKSPEYVFLYIITMKPWFTMKKSDVIALMFSIVQQFWKFSLFFTHFWDIFCLKNGSSQSYIQLFFIFSPDIDLTREQKLLVLIWESFNSFVVFLGQIDDGDLERFVIMFVLFWLKISVIKLNGALFATKLRSMMLLSKCQDFFLLYMKFLTVLSYYTLTIES